MNSSWFVLLKIKSRQKYVHLHKTKGVDHNFRTKLTFGNILKMIKWLKNYIQLVSYGNFKSILNLKTILKHFFILFSEKPFWEAWRECNKCDVDINMQIMKQIDSNLNTFSKTIWQINNRRLSLQPGTHQNQFPEH